jgi:hypothetical protein
MRCYSEVVDFTLPSRCHLRPDGCALRFHRTALAGWGRDKVSRVFGHCTQNRGKRRGHWDPCPSLLDGDTGSEKPPNKEAGPYAWGVSF